MAPRSDDGKKRARHAEVVANWRSREARCVKLFKFEAGTLEFDLAIKYGGLREDQTNDDDAATLAIGKMLRRAMAALVSQEKKK